MYCGYKSSKPACLPCPSKEQTESIDGKNYNKVVLQTRQCSEPNIKAMDTNSELTQNDINDNIEACMGKVQIKKSSGSADFVNVYRSVNSCGGYPFNFDDVNKYGDQLPSTQPSYQGNKDLEICGRPMYAAGCYQWDDTYQITGENQAAVVGIDTSPLGVLKNFKYAGGIPSTIAASLALVVAIPAIINGIMAMNENDGGVKATGGLAIGFTIIGFCSSLICLIIVCVAAGVAEASKYLFAIFDGYKTSDDCPSSSKCYKSVVEQASLSGVISYYFRVLAWMNGFLFAISIIQAIFAVVVCCSMRRR